MIIRHLKAAAIATALCICPVAASAAPFTITVTVDGTTAARAFSNAESVFRALESDELQSLVSSYNDASAASATIDFRGLPMTFSFDANQDDLRLQIPELDIDQTFSGTDRDASIDELVDSFKDGANSFGQIQKKLSAKSAIDPVAGNPQSLMNMLVDETFANDAFDERLINGRPYNPKGDARLRPGKSRSIGARITDFTANGQEGRSFVIPWNFTGSPSARTTLKFGMPMGYWNVDGATILNFGARVAAQTRLTPRWSLTPSAAWGATFSYDLGSVSHLVNFALTSRYELPFGNGKVVIGNTGGYARTLGLEAGGYNFDPQISNYYMKNGAQIESGKLHLLGRSSNLKASYALTTYFGSDLYMDTLHEFGASLGGGGLADLPLGVEIKKTIANDYDALSLGAFIRY